MYVNSISSSFLVKSMVTVIAILHRIYRKLLLICKKIIYKIYCISREKER